jgi:hypothetical protein
VDWKDTKPDAYDRRVFRFLQDAWLAALCDLLQLGDEEITKDRLYRGLDHLLVHKAAVEAQIIVPIASRC